MEEERNAKRKASGDDSDSSEFSGANEDIGSDSEPESAVNDDSDSEDDGKSHERLAEDQSGGDEDGEEKQIDNSAAEESDTSGDEEPESESDEQSEAEEGSADEEEEDDEASEEEEDAEDGEEEAEAKAIEEKISKASKLREQFGTSATINAVKNLFDVKFSGSSNARGQYYLLAGGSLDELIAQLQFIDTKKKSHTIIFFRAIQVTLIRVMQEKLMDPDELSEVCKHFVTDHIADVLVHLSTSSPVHFQKSAIKLLSALATVDDVIAFQLLSSLNLSKNQLTMLTLHEDPSNPISLRVLFIHFLMAFIIGHSDGVIRQLCTKTKWLPAIFDGLKYDLLSTVGLVLKTLDDNVIQNAGVHKTAKLFVFNSKALANLADLYRWDPAAYLELPRAKHNNKLKIKPTEPEELESVRELVHKVLLHLVTSTEFGVVFKDPSYGTSTLVANSTVNQFMKESGQPWEDPLKEELFSQMLSTCPDLMKSFYNLVGQQLLTRTASKWQKICLFLTRVISKIKINPDSFTAVARAFNVSSDIILPAFILDAIAASFTGLNAEGVLPGLLLFTAALSKIQEIGCSLKAYRAAHNKPFISKVSDYLCASSLTADKMLKALSNLYEAKNVQGITALCDVFFLLGELAPQTLDCVKFNGTYIKTLRDIAKESKSLGKANSIIKIKLFKVQLLLDSQSVKKEGDFDLGEVCGLLKSEEQETKNLSLSIIRDVLHNTGFFPDDHWELDLWMLCIKEHVHPGFGSKLAAAICYAESNKFELSNAVLRSHHQKPLLSFETEDLKLDDFLAMVDQDVDSVDMSSLNLRLSPLLPGFLRANAKIGNVTKAFIIYYAHMVSSQGFATLVKDSLGKDHLIVDYLTVLSNGDCMSLNVSPFAGTVFERVSNFIVEGTDEECLNEIGTTNVELLASLTIRFAMNSLNHPDRLSRAVHFLSQLCQAQPSVAPSLSSENVLRYAGVLEGFHPVLLGTAHTNDVVSILGSAVADRNHPNLKPFAHRIYFELEYAITKKLHLEGVGITCLESFLKTFPLSKAQLNKLISKIFTLNSKFFVRKGHVTPWTKVVEHLLSMTPSMKLVWSETELSSLMEVIIPTVRHNEVSRIPDLLYDYLSQTKLELSGSLLDASVALLNVMCTADVWYEKMACFLMEKVDEQLGPLPEGMEFLREVMLLASTPKVGSRSLDHSSRAAIKSLSSDQGYLAQLANIASEAFSTEVCSKMASKAKKHSADVYPTSNALKVLEAVFSKADKSLELLHLVLGWLETFTLQNPDICVGIADSLERLASKVDASDLPELKSELMEFLVNEGLSRSCQSMIGVTRIFLNAGRLSVDPGSVFQKLTSHSQFDSTLMGSNENFKCAFITLLSNLIEKDGSLINGERLPGFLSAYHATLSQSDQLILKILQQHERCGVNLTNYQPLLWGSAALSHYSVHKKPALYRTNPLQTLNALTPSLVINTIANFPIHRDTQGIVEGDSKVYDPAFILPILCQTVLPGHRIKSRTFFQSGAVGLALASLASSSPNIRSVATLFLQRLHENHLGLDKLVWSNFIDAIRRGVAEEVKKEKEKKVNKKPKMNTKVEAEVPRMCSITATFLARASTVLGTPSGPLFRPLHRFVLARPSLRLSGVPAFLELLHSTNVKYHETHREWILEVIRDGMREEKDLKAVLNSFTMKIILIFYSSSLAKPYAKKVIEQIVVKCLKCADKDGLLLNGYSLLPWILDKKPSPSPQLVAALPKLWPTNQHAALLSLATR